MRRGKMKKRSCRNMCLQKGENKKTHILTKHATVAQYLEVKLRFRNMKKKKTIDRPQTKTLCSTAAFSLGLIGVKHGLNSCVRAVQVFLCGRGLGMISMERKSLLMENQVCQPPTGNHSFIWVTTLTLTLNRAFSAPYNTCQYSV